MSPGMALSPNVPACLVKPGYLVMTLRRTSQCSM
jgi:hypothetical protein